MTELYKVLNSINAEISRLTETMHNENSTENQKHNAKMDINNLTKDVETLHDAQRLIRVYRNTVQ